jgi:hypothetical protein
LIGVKPRKASGTAKNSRLNADGASTPIGFHAAFQSAISSDV